MPDTALPNTTRRDGTPRRSYPRYFRWLSRVASRDQVISSVKSLAWVIPLTILIWIYAEREQTLEVPDVSFPFEVKSSDPHYVVHLRTQDNNIVAELSGPRAQVDAVRPLLASSPPPVQITIDNPKPGTLNLPTDDRIANQSIFTTHGVSARKCRPANLPVEIDELLERDVPIKAPSDITELDGAPTFAPATVHVKAPRAAFDRLKGELVVNANIAKLDVLKQPGPHEVDGVTLSWLGSMDDVTFTPATVHATINVKQSDVTYEIPSVPVYLVTPSGLLDTLHVDYSPTIKNVKVIGPPDKIALIRSDEATIRALLDLNNSDRSGAVEKTRTVRYEQLPDGVHISPDDKQRQVTFKLVAREAPATP